MDRLRLINTTRDIPLSLYHQDTIEELSMRRILLHYRQTEINLSTEGAPPFYYRWIHDLEWREHYDMPRLQSYSSIDVVMAGHQEEYCLIRFLNPPIYYVKVTESPRMSLPILGKQATESRFFNRTF